MNKNRTIILLVALSILTISMVVYGADSGVEVESDRPVDSWSYREKSHNHREDHLKKSYDREDISQEEKWEDHDHHKCLDKLYGRNINCGRNNGHKFHGENFRNHHKNRIYKYKK